jgi:hypothetical protein
VRQYLCICTSSCVSICTFVLLANLLDSNENTTNRRITSGIPGTVGTVGTVETVGGVRTYHSAVLVKACSASPQVLVALFHEVFPLFHEVFQDSAASAPAAPSGSLFVLLY